MPIGAHAFLFDADDDGVPADFGGLFDPALLLALSAADPEGLTVTRAMRGDVLVASLSRRIVAVTGSGHGRGRTIGHDQDLYRTVIWDLGDALAGQWHTLDLETFPTILGTHGVHCVTLSGLSSDYRGRIDTTLRSTIGYLGCLEIDLGNPLQRELFVFRLIDDAVIAGGTVIMEMSWEGYPESSLDGAATFAPGGERRVQYGELDAQRPPLPDMSRLSDRGRVSLDRYNGKRTYTVQERVLDALSRQWPIGDERVPYEFVRSPGSGDVLQVDLPEAKFVLYLLNEQHENNNGKAKFFRETLGIASADWRYLASQFYGGLVKAELVDVHTKSWRDGIGVSFNSDIAIRGLNGRVAMIKTNWIMTPGCLPRLSTAYPAAPRAELAPLSLAESNIVASQLAGNERWEKLYQLADSVGRITANNCVPTPMQISGYPIEMEGMCGWADIRVRDARRGFARWLVRSGKGNRHYRSGAVIHARPGSQSVDRAVAYANAFAAVLRLNGVECAVSSQLD